MRAPPAMKPEEMSVPRLLRRSASSLSLVDLLDEVGDEAADEERRRQGQGQVHAQGEGQRRHLGQLGDQGHRGADGVEEPGHGLARHHRLDDRGHEIGLGRGQGAALEREGLVQDVDGHADGQRRDEDAGELEPLLVARRRPQPVADLEVGDEAARDRQGRADDGADEQGHGHALLPDRPAPSRMTLDRMIVIRVMPETGFVPTMAMA